MSSPDPLPLADLYFCGDPHSDFRAIERAARHDGETPFILLGDYDLSCPLEQAIPHAAPRAWWIHGNHDADRVDWHDYLFHSALAERNLHGRITEIAGMRVAGLGGVFRGSIWHPETAVRFRSPADYLNAIPPRDHWRAGLPLKHRASIWFSDYEALWEQQADILVTHEAPSCHHHGFSALDDLAQSLGVRLIVHGHHHETYTGHLPCGIQVQGVGLGEVVSLKRLFAAS